MRTFIAIEVPDSERKTLALMVEEFCRHDLPIKWVKPQNMHVTIKFLGEVNETGSVKVKEAVNSICRKMAVFNMRLNGIGCFPRPNNARVIWVGVDRGGSELNMLAENLESSLQTLGFKAEGRFHPHLTIGRIRQRCNINEILLKKFQGDSFSVEKVTLFESKLLPKGPIYRAIENFSLKAV